ncbi:MULTISPECIES: DUF2201 family putative metallopeptidase [Halomonas]|uniref:Putative metallopeptidase-like protein n=1 Tax=Halomonas ventosae TaxID=229007 RepID=A0A4V3BZD4_9GAMM|nr:hypothetical protein [Halomonas ventosae]TDO06079.1 putative metallopeptidase-like protein [Halomonas ventosae]
MGSEREGFSGEGRPICHEAAARGVEVEEQQAALWQADRAAWARDQPVTARLASHLSLATVSGAHLPTATTDGRHLLFNAAWSAGLDTRTRRFLQAHLVWHCVAGHLHAPRDWERRRWHLACDHKVNALLLLLGIPLPDDAVLFPACIGQSLPAVYDWLGHFPGLESERSLDMAPITWTSHLSDDTLLRWWQEKAQEVAKRYLGTPYLSGHVAAFLVTRQ